MKANIRAVYFFMLCTSLHPSSIFVLVGMVSIPPYLTHGWLNKVSNSPAPLGNHWPLLLNEYVRPVLLDVKWWNVDVSMDTLSIMVMGIADKKNFTKCISVMLPTELHKHKCGRSWCPFVFIPSPQRRAMSLIFPSTSVLVKRFGQPAQMQTRNFQSLTWK